MIDAKFQYLKVHLCKSNLEYRESETMSTLQLVQVWLHFLKIVADYACCNIFNLKDGQSSVFNLGKHLIKHKTYLKAEEYLAKSSLPQELHAYGQYRLALDDETSSCA